MGAIARDQQRQPMLMKAVRHEPPGLLLGLQPGFEGEKIIAIAAAVQLLSCANINKAVWNAAGLLQNLICR